MLMMVMSSLPSSFKFQSKSYENKHAKFTALYSEKLKKVDKWCVILKDRIVKHYKYPDIKN